MRLSKIAALALLGTDKDTKEELASKLGTSVKSLYRWIQDNKTDGPLTKRPALDLITVAIGLDPGTKEFNHDLLIEEDEEPSTEALLDKL